MHKDLEPGLPVEKVKKEIGEALYAEYNRSLSTHENTHLYYNPERGIIHTDWRNVMPEDTEILSDGHFKIEPFYEQMEGLLTPEQMQYYKNLCNGEARCSRDTALNLMLGSLYTDALKDYCHELADAGVDRALAKTQEREAEEPEKRPEKQKPKYRGR